MTYLEVFLFHEDWDKMQFEGYTYIFRKIYLFKLSRF